jgi:asparagine synthase (glutamine-hydrolysing)
MPTYITRRIAKIKSSSDVVKKIIDTKKLRIRPVHPFDIIPIGYKTVSDVSEHFTFFSSLPKYLHWEDRDSMVHSVEAQVPFLDHRLVEFVYNLPNDFLKNDGISKRIMRHAMSDILPERTIKRYDKMGFSTPEEIWVKKEYPELFRNKISEAIAVTNGIIKRLSKI